MRGGDPQRDAVEMVAQRLGRLHATINSTQTWALEADQPQLLDAAEAARATWADTKLVFDGYQEDIQAYTNAEIDLDAQASQ
eukprot:8926107-Prorocentrum_lima.AAC.1